MSTLKRFLVTAEGTDHELTLEVDLARLTAATATEINTFLGGAARRLSMANCDVVQVALRLFATQAIRLLLVDGGADFGEHNDVCGRIWSRSVQEVEGFGGADESPFGWCGIRIVSASVVVPPYECVELEAVDG